MKMKAPAATAGVSVFLPSPSTLSFLSSLFFLPFLSTLPFLSFLSSLSSLSSLPSLSPLSSVLSLHFSSFLVPFSVAPFSLCSRQNPLNER